MNIKLRFFSELIVVAGLVGFLPHAVPDAQANGNVHVSRFWHNHQPIYWPEWNNNGPETQRGQYANDSMILKPSQNYGGISPKYHPENNLGDIFGWDDRKNAYQSGPRNSLAAFTGGGFGLSYSASLIANVRQLGNTGALGYGSGWNSGNTEARGWGRLDLVGMTAHHAIAPLLPKDVLRKEIQVFKQAWWKAWGGNSDLSDHSKGFFPTEMAYSRHIIDVLVDEGYEWVIVPSHHISRTSPSYNTKANPEGSYNIASTPPNKADQLSPTFSDGWWFGSGNVGEKSWNVSPFAYQLHKVQYVNPNTGAIKEMIAVPSDDELSYRYGYANEGISKIQTYISPFATDPNRPVIVMPATDGDNAWGGGNSSWMEATPQYFNDSAAAGYVKDTPGGFVNAYKANAPVTHIEDGAWIFPEMCYGSPNFLKWVEPPLNAKNLASCYPGTMADLETPGFALKFFSYAPLMAGANWVITAEQILRGEGGDVRPWVIQEPYDWSGTGFGDRNDVELAWHIYLKGLDSGFNYYGGLGNDDEVKPALATKRAIDKLQSYMSTRLHLDQTPPTVFKPQRFPYNPGEYTFGWYNNTSAQPGFLKKMGSEFYVWTHAYDVSGIPAGGVVLKVRRDKDGLNAMASTHNETYAGGSDVEDWVSIPMNKRVLPKTRSALNAAADNGDIDYFVFDPAFWSDPVLADYYFAKITDASVPDFRGKLLDYYIEATDSRGNVHKSEIQHVWVGDDGQGGSSVSFSSDPRDCAPLTVTYYAAGDVLDGVSPIYQQISFDGGSTWTRQQMSSSQANVWSFANTVPDNTSSAIVWFENSTGSIVDSNSSANWSTSIRDCEAPVFVNGVNVNPAPPVAGQTVTITYDPAGRELASATAVNIHYGYNGANWTTVPGVPMTKSGNYWTYTYTVPAAASSIVMCFNDGTTWDNNGGNNWTFAVTPVTVPDGVVITDPAASPLTVENSIASYTLEGTAGANLTGSLLWTNTASGQHGSFTRQSVWSVSVPLVVGENEITISGLIAGTGGETVVAEDSATDAAYAGGAWPNGSNGGTGFGAWTLNAVEGSSGHFSGANGWGMWSHEGGNLSESIRPFSAPLAVGQTFQVRMKNGWIWEDTDNGGANPGSIGVALRDSEGTTVWELYFNGGDQFYNTPAGPTDIGWTDAGLDIAFTLTAAGAYSVTVQPVGGTVRTYMGTFTGSIADFRAWSYNNGTDDGQNSNRDYFVDNLQITAPGGGEGTYSTATVTIIRQGSGGESPSIPPIVFEAGTGFTFEIPTGYSLVRVEGANELAGFNWNWTELTRDVDYELNGGQLTILTEAAQKRMIRVYLAPIPPP